MNNCGKLWRPLSRKSKRCPLTISAILRISAVEHGARETQFKDFDLAAVCAQLLDFYEPFAESNDVTMIVDAATPVPVRGDPDLMREALSNLIDNAIKFSPLAAWSASRPVWPKGGPLCL